jgi:hypothetical protein
MPYCKTLPFHSVEDIHPLATRTKGSNDSRSRESAVEYLISRRPQTLPSRLKTALAGSRPDTLSSPSYLGDSQLRYHGTDQYRTELLYGTALKSNNSVPNGTVL